MTKKLKNYIQTLPFLGIVSISGGLVFALVMLNVKNPEDWATYNFYYKVLGAFLGYFYITWWYPGGRVTLNFDKSTYNEDERALYDLIVKYKSNKLMIVPPIIYLVSDFIVSQMHKTSYVGNFEGYLASFVMGAFISTSMCFGIKNLSAWWNIKKSWKKEFGE